MVSNNSSNLSLDKYIHSYNQLKKNTCFQKYKLSFDDYTKILDYTDLPQLYEQELLGGIIGKIREYNTRATEKNDEESEELNDIKDDSLKSLIKESNLETIDNSSLNNMPYLFDELCKPLYNGCSTNIFYIPKNSYNKNQLTSNIQIIPKQYISWNIDFNEYNPLKKDGTNAVLHNDVKWNTITKGKKRYSYVSTIKTIKYSDDDRYYPLNPMGRTGVRGSNWNLEYGPNHYISFIPYYTEDDKTYIILNLGEKDTLNLTTIFNMKEDINIEDEANKYMKEGIGNYSIVVKKIYNGYQDIYTNTDNSWNELSVYIIQLSEKPVLNKDKYLDIELNDISKYKNINTSITPFIDLTKEILEYINL